MVKQFCHIEISTNCLRLLVGTELNGELSNWLSEAVVSHGPARAIIAP